MSLHSSSIASKDFLKRRGLMLVLSSPSGAGKSSIAKVLLGKDKNLCMSVSMTTRSKRPGETEGKDYFFVNKEIFEQKIKEESFLEYANVFGQYYGTPKYFVDEALSKGKDILFDIDWQGVQQLNQQMEVDLVRIFILPPSYQELEKRLTTRAQDSKEVVKNRMNKACDEMSHWPEYEYVLINENLEESIEKVYAILKAERLKRFRQIGLADFVSQIRVQQEEVA